MADVFISYASEDRERARKLAGALEEGRWSVWWDRKIIAGETFDQVIEHELETAKCVVVLWSKDSIRSEWVKNEAAVAAERGVLVPALIDKVKLPLEFRRKQTADLAGWDGTRSHEGFQALWQAVASKAKITGPAQLQLTTVPRGGLRRYRGWILGASVAIAVGVITVLITWGGFHRVANKPTIVEPKQTESTAPSVLALEAQLKVINIEISTGTEEDAARVRGYFTGPTSAYHLLAVNCLQLLGNRRLKETGYLDMIDKFYTLLVGGEEHFDGARDHQKLKEAIVKANNEIHGQNAKSFEEVVEPIR